MRRKKWEIPTILLLGGLLGFGVATYRNQVTGQAVAGDPCRESCQGR